MSPISPYSPQNHGTPHILEDYMPVPAPTRSSPPTSCATCHASSAPNLCSSCRNTRYCSVACQKSDWTSSHKFVCKLYTASLAQRPHPHARRALFCPVSGTKPSFIYLPPPYPSPSSSSADSEENPLTPFFPNTPSIDLSTLSFHNRQLPYFIQIIYDANPHSTRALHVNKTLGPPLRGAIVVRAFDPEVGLSGMPWDVCVRGWGVLGEYVKLRREYVGVVFVEVSEREVSG